VIELGEGGLSWGTSATLKWSAFRLELSDKNADGVLDSGTGSMSGDWHAFRGDVHDLAKYEASLRVMPDTTAPVATILPASGGREDSFLALESIDVAFSEPVSWPEVQSGTRVLADTAAVTGDLQPGPLAQGWVTHVALVPSAHLPLATELRLEIGSVRRSERQSRRMG
jgi:hypothetical protein